MIQSEAGESFHERVYTHGAALAFNVARFTITHLLK